MWLGNLCLDMTYRYRFEHTELLISWSSGVKGQTSKILNEVKYAYLTTIRKTDRMTFDVIWLENANVSYFSSVRLNTLPDGTTIELHAYYLRFRTYGNFTPGICPGTCRGTNPGTNPQCEGTITCTFSARLFLLQCRLCYSVPCVTTRLARVSPTGHWWRCWNFRIAGRILLR